MKAETAAAPGPRLARSPGATLAAPRAIQAVPDRRGAKTPSTTKPGREQG
jgi:hypothetical protein